MLEDEFTHDVDEENRLDLVKFSLSDSTILANEEKDDVSGHLLHEFDD
jgi:hypothetical protein